MTKNKNTLPIMKELPVRIAVVDRELCNPQKCALECMKACPINRQNKPCIQIDPVINKAVIDEELCIGCKLCVPACPFEAISIVNLPHELAENPVHQFHANSFRIYKLPSPKPGTVLGLMGRNGTGKTTALKIFTGLMVPNLGNLELEASYALVSKAFKGKELQTFFEKLASGKLKYAYKPQNVDKLSEQVKGKVGELLKKVDERRKFDEMVKELELGNVLGNSLNEISGGELQRMAIAATVLKNADFYFFDEPTSYLDIHQRLNVARVIRNLAEQGKTVVVVEHDLAVLDYLADYVTILFGEPAVYGIASETRSVRNGINEFLDGYLKTENVRIRKKELTFAGTSIKQEKRGESIAYPDMEKKFAQFQLDVEQGTIQKGEVLAVVGANGIGKTTFVQMLAGVIKPDQSAWENALKVSYKPQYLKAAAGVKVQELLWKEKIDMDLFRNEFEQKLGIHKLLEKNIENLSGGELQKVAVALALCKPCDMILLDEPTAFIDVEDRLVLADTVRHIAFQKNLPILVVDHDISFQEYIADRVLVFEGVPGKKGIVKKAQDVRSGMNALLKMLDITFRRDTSTKRLRVNKSGSVLDQEQRASGNYYMYA